MHMLLGQVDAQLSLKNDIGKNGFKRITLKKFFLLDFRISDVILGVDNSSNDMIGFTLQSICYKGLDDMLDIAQDLIKDWIETGIRLFGRGFCAPNVHGLLHLPQVHYLA